MSLNTTTEKKDTNSLVFSYKETNVFFVNSVIALYTKPENHVLTPNISIHVEQTRFSLIPLAWLQCINDHG